MLDSEGRGGRAGLLRLNRHHGLAAEIVDGGELEVIPRIAQRGQILQVDVQQLTWPLFLVPLRRRTARARQPVDAVVFKQSLHCPVAELELARRSRSHFAGRPATAGHDELVRAASFVGEWCGRRECGCNAASPPSWYACHHRDSTTRDTSYSRLNAINVSPC